jgi:RNA polymerase sigma-70 factor (ECF subfamily)
VTAALPTEMLFGPRGWTRPILPAVAEPDELAARAQQQAREAERNEERELVARAQAGDKRAMGELFHRFGPGLYRSVLLPRLGSEAAAKDALSETYAKVVQRLHQFTWQNVGFYPWLRTVALRVALDQLRARKRLVLWEDDAVAREIDKSQTTTPVEQQVSDRRDREAARAKVDTALETIHPRYARAIRLRILEERPREEVAQMLEVTPATFDVLLHRAIGALKKQLQKAEGNDD